MEQCVLEELIVDLVCDFGLFGLAYAHIAFGALRPRNQVPVVAAGCQGLAQGALLRVLARLSCAVLILGRWVERAWLKSCSLTKFGRLLLSTCLGRSSDFGSHTCSILRFGRLDTLLLLLGRFQVFLLILLELRQDLVFVELVSEARASAHCLIDQENLVSCHDDPRGFLGGWLTQHVLVCSFVAQAVERVHDFGPQAINHAVRFR